MSKPITNTPKFDPFIDVLADDKRLRLKDGQLIVEDSTVRSKASAWSRFWTRGQYSQSAILKEMSKLYKTTKNEQKEEKTQHINNTFLANYKTLVKRVIKQNVECSKLNSLSRFFNAQSSINLDKAYSKIDEIYKALEKEEAAIKLKAQEKALADKETDEKIDIEIAPEVGELIELKTQINERISETLKSDYKIEHKTPWWSLEEPDNDTPVLWTTDNFIGRPFMLLNPLGKKAKDGNDSDQLDKLLIALDLDTVEKQKEKKINGPLHLELYLLKNKEALVQKLRTLDFIE